MQHMGARAMQHMGAPAMEHMGAPAMERALLRTTASEIVSAPLIWLSPFLMSVHLPAPGNMRVRVRGA